MFHQHLFECHRVKNAIIILTQKRFPKMIMQIDDFSIWKLFIKHTGLFLTPEKMQPFFICSVLIYLLPFILINKGSFYRKAVNTTALIKFIILNTRRHPKSLYILIPANLNFGKYLYFYSGYIKKIIHSFLYIKIRRSHLLLISILFL